MVGGTALTKLEKYFMNNWDKTFSPKELIEMGVFGDKHAVNYRLTNSRYIRRVRMGVYQFTPVRKPDAKPMFKQITELLKERGEMTESELAKAMSCSTLSVKKCIYRMRAEGIEVKRQSAYRLGDGKW